MLDVQPVAAASSAKQISAPGWDAVYGYTDHRLGFDGVGPRGGAGSRNSRAAPLAQWPGYAQEEDRSGLFTSSAASSPSTVDRFRRDSSTIFAA